MLHPFRYGRCIALLALTLLPLCGVFAAPAAPATPQIGVIDLDVTQQKFDGFKEAMIHIKAFTQERDNMFGALKKGIGLSSQDFNEYQGLVSFTVKMNEARCTALETQAKANVDEYQKLKGKQENKETLTDTEKARLDVLNKDIETVSKLVNDQGDKLYNEVQEEYGRYSKLLTDLVDKAIDTTAKEKKLSIVLSKNMQSKEGVEKSVLWGGVDITDDVVTALNKSFKPGMLDKAAGKPADKPADK